MKNKWEEKKREEIEHSSEYTQRALAVFRSLNTKHIFFLYIFKNPAGHFCPNAAALANTMAITITRRCGYCWLYYMHPYT